MNHVKDIDPKHDHADVRKCDLIKGREQCDSSKPQVQCHSPPHIIEKPDQEQCVRSKKGWRCSNMASPGSIYCDKHHLERDAYNGKRRKGPKRHNCYIAFLPSGQPRCRRLGKRWQCHEMASHGLYCDKHQVQEGIHNENRRKGAPRPNRVLMTLLSLGQGQSKCSGNEGSNSDQLTALKMTREEIRGSNTNDVMTNPIGNDGAKQVSSGPVESGGEVTKKRKVRKRLRDKETISDDLVLGLGQKTKKCRGPSVNDEKEEIGGVVKHTREMIPENSTEGSIRKTPSNKIADMDLTERASRTEIIVTEKISSMEDAQSLSVISEESRNPASTDNGILPDERLGEAPMKCQENEQSDTFQTFWSDENIDELMMENENSLFMKILSSSSVNLPNKEKQIR